MDTLWCSADRRIRPDRSQRPHRVHGLQRSISAFRRTQIEQVRARPLQRLEGAMFSDEAWRALAKSLRWSHRESQIVPALFDDKKETAIAAGLGISRHTVHTHTERLYRKMGITSRVGLVRRIFLEYLRLATRPECRVNSRKPRPP